MAVNLYRRHRLECEAGRAEESRSGEFEERRKGWKRCACLIFASGTLDGKFRRKCTGKSAWDDAKAVAAEWEKARSWDGEIVLPLAPEVSQAGRVTIERAVKLFLDELQETAAFATHKKYRLLLKRLVVFSSQRGYVMIDQWEPLDVRQFRSTWPVSPATAVRRMAMLKPFFEYCVSNKWIASNPARAVKNPKTRGMKHSEQKFPFTDEELKRTYDACPRYGQTYRHKWKGEDLADFISLSIYTGLRISDVALFHIDRLRPDSGEILIRTTKAGTHVYTWVPEWLQERIRTRAKDVGPLIFGAHRQTTLDIITETWRRRLNRLWAMCGPWKIKPHPHRFRHTFARILLQRGVSVQDVADLLGNTEAIVRKSYSAWVPERQERLVGILKDAFADKPKPMPKVVSIR
jgi:integrase